MLKQSLPIFFRLLTRRKSTRSFSGEASLEKCADLPTSVDAVVIGGGSIGCSTLYHLAKYGVKNAILLERNQLTSGTTWHTAGLYWCLRPSDIDIELLAYSKRLITSTLPQEAGMEVGWINNGGLFIASTKERLDEYKRMYSLAPVYGVEAHLLGPEETKRLYPLMNVDDVYGTLYSPGDGIIDPASWCAALTKVAKKFGARVFENCPVKEIVTKNDEFGIRRVDGVLTKSGQSIKAPVVINCAGAWAPKLFSPLGVNLPTMAMHHGYVITERIGDNVRGTPNIRDHDSAIYVRLQGDALVFGGYESNPVFWENVDDDFVFGLFEMDWNRFEVHTRGACNRIPVLKTTGIKSHVCGPMSFTPDHKPLMGETSEIRGLFVACGMELGMMMGGGYGRQTALWAINGRPDLHMHAYDLRRFNPDVTRKHQWIKEKLHEAVYTMYKIHWPRDEPLAGRDQLKSPFHNPLSEGGCVFQERHGWERPGWFAEDGRPSPILAYDYYGAYGPDRTPKHKNYLYEHRLTNDYSWEFPKHHDLIKKECWIVRNEVGLIDMSYFGKFYVTGPDAEKTVDYIFASDIVSKPIGSSVYTCMLNKIGGVESDAVVSTLDAREIDFAREAGSKLFYVSASGAIQTHVRSHMQNVIDDQRFDVQLLNRTGDEGILGVLGPQSRELLQSLTQTDLKSMPSRTHALIKIDGHQCRFFRLSFAAELGYELHIPKEACLAIFTALRRNGRKFRLKNVGFRAYESLLAENDYRFWDGDLRFTDSPLETGMADMCDKVNTNRDFLGREALFQQQNRGLEKSLASFVLDSHVPLWSLEAIYRNGQPVGFVRRAEYAYTLDKPIAFGFVKTTDGSILTEDWINSGQYEIEAMGMRYAAQIRLEQSNRKNDKPK